MKHILILCLVSIIVLITLFFGAYSTYQINANRNACEAKGGKYLKSINGNVCSIVEPAHL